MQHVTYRLEYAAVVRCPFLKKDINKLDKVQTCCLMASGTKKESYVERLEMLYMLQVDDRRKQRGNIINRYNIVPNGQRRGGIFQTSNFKKKCS